MKKTLFPIPEHERDLSHSYSSYGLQGHWMNRGEFLEMAYKMAISDNPEKSNRDYKTGYDMRIDDIRVSVKSNGASLSYETGSPIRSNIEREKLMKRFFAKAVFDELHYVIWMNDKQAIAYHLDRQEAKEFFTYAIAWRMSGEETSGNAACYKLKFSFSDAKASEMLEKALRTGNFDPPKKGRKPVLTESALERQRAEKQKEHDKRKQAFDANGQIRNKYQQNKLRKQLLQGL